MQAVNQFEGIFHKIHLVHFFLDIIRFLLNHGADVNLTDDFGWNALHFACR